MVKRNIIKIDKGLCNGCTLCIDVCTEGALEMVNGFANLSDEKFCDGYGACISECKPGALRIEEREAAEFDEKAARSHREQKGKKIEEKENVNWPLKLSMVSPEADFFKDSNIFVVSDCVPFSMKNFHDMILKDKSSIVVSCPKFEKIDSYRDKLKTILENSNPKTVTVVHMEIPCCNDIYSSVEDLIKSINVEVPLHRIIVGTNGTVKLVY